MGDPSPAPAAPAPSAPAGWGWCAQWRISEVTSYPEMDRKWMETSFFLGFTEVHYGLVNS